MSRLMASALIILISATLAFAQKRSDKQVHDLVGPVKVVRETTVCFDYKDGQYSELPDHEPIKAVKVFDREGMLLFSEVINSVPICGFPRRSKGVGDPAQRIYDPEGNLVEYMPGDSIEHSSYRLKHKYDANGKIIETEYYDPYILRNKWTYTYEEFDERGNWTARTVTPLRGDTTYDKVCKKEEYRAITYY